MKVSSFPKFAGAVLMLAVCASAQAVEQAAAALSPSSPSVPAVFEHAATPEQIQKILGPAAGALRASAVLRGGFTQKKFLKELPQPLVSSGEFVVARGLGVDWHTQKPFNATVVLTPQALIQRGADGSSKTVSSDQQPGLRAVGDVFDALFTLDIVKLGETFMLFGEPGEKNTWTLGLVPREAAFAKVMNRIQITGSTQPSKIVLFEGSGDHTEIEFGKVDAQSELAEADRKRFAP